MGAITGTKVKLTELGGKQKILLITAPLAAASDEITLTEAKHGCTEITGIMGLVITGGQDAAFTAASASFSGMVITVVSVEQDGTAATNFTGATVSISLLVK